MAFLPRAQSRLQTKRLWSQSFPSYGRFGPARSSTAIVWSPASRRSRCSVCLNRRFPSAVEAHVSRLLSEPERSADAVGEETRDALPRYRKLQQPCASAFIGRVVMGTCVRETVTTDVAEDNRGSVRIRSVSLTPTVYYYDFGDVFDSDRRMRQCMQAGGRWTALPPSSSQFQAARDEHELRRAQSQLERLERRHR